MEKSTNKVKCMWQIIKQRTNKISNNTRHNIKLLIHNQLSSDPKLVSNTFNELFISAGRSRAADAGGSPRGQPVLQPSENSLFLRPVDPHEVEKIITNLKSKPSCGIDELPSTLIKACAEELTPPLTYIINQSFTEGVFPDLLKVALIKPVHKKNDKSDPNNYRPIALLPVISKIYEKAMCSRLYSFCEKFEIFDDAQNGFRKNRSTTLATYKYTNEILKILNNKEYAIGVLLDMTKAYEKVKYNILLEKLHGVGVRGITHEWFQSYLENRNQYVEIEHVDELSHEIRSIRSECQPVTASIPQGTVIGCALFIIYINDMPKMFKEPCIMFADDCSLLFSCRDNETLQGKLNDSMSKVVSWMNDHNLEINFAKTKVMQFRPRQKCELDLSACSYNNIKLECVPTFSLLGISIDSNINWKCHVQKVKAKMSQFIYALRELKKSTDIQTAIVAYYAYAHAWLSYGVTLWGNSTNVQELFLLQKKCIRIITHIKQTDSCKTHFQNLQILTLPSMYVFESCKFVRNHPKLYSTVGDEPRRYESRFKNNLVQTTSKLKLHSNGPYAMSIRIYNKLPPQIKNEHNIKVFTRTLKKYLIEKAYYSVRDYINS
jgi:hypothetical protein